MLKDWKKIDILYWNISKTIKKNKKTKNTTKKNYKYVEEIIHRKHDDEESYNEDGF